MEGNPRSGYGASPTVAVAKERRAVEWEVLKALGWGLLSLNEGFAHFKGVDGYIFGHHYNIELNGRNEDLSLNQLRCVDYGQQSISKLAHVRQLQRWTPGMHGDDINA